MIIAKNKNLLKNLKNEKLDAIMNAANGTGPMGAGIAGAIRKFGGKEIQNDAFKVCKELDPQPGDAYVTIAGALPIKMVIHAVTMKRPGGETSYIFIYNAFKSVLKRAIKEKIKRIGCTALGTGIGGLDPEIVGKIMYNVAVKFQDKIDVIFMDFDKSFIESINEEVKNAEI